MPRELATMLGLLLLAQSTIANAQEGEGERAPARLRQAPGEPQVRSARPSIPFGIAPSQSRDNVLDFHGYLLVPLRIGVHERENPYPGQESTVLHAPPLVPQDLRSFEYTGAIPTPWVQLDFTYGNEIISGTAIIAATQATDATGLYNPVEQLGVNDAFITVNLDEPVGTPLTVRVGAMTGRYGAMGAYDAGRYGTPLIARTNTVGESLTLEYPVGDISIVVEQGFGGQLARPPRGMVPAGWNDFADENVGASFVNQLHAGLVYGRLAHLGLHYLTAFSQDDEGPDGTVPDGTITVLGADARLTAGRAGHLYLGGAWTEATNSTRVSGVLEVLNARGGPELAEEYFGPQSEGDGSLTTVGAQYDLSVSRAVFGDVYEGHSPDVLFSLFGIMTSVSSDDADYDGITKLKLGTELTYSALSWFGVAARFDHVNQDSGNPRAAFNILSPRVLFHTDWLSRDEFALQYSYFSYGSEVIVQTGFPPEDDPDANPDKHVFTLSGTFWW